MDEPHGLRVALIAGTLGQGGAEKQLVYMARALRDAGAGVSVFSLQSGELHEDTLRRLGIPVTAVGRGGGRAGRLARLATAVVRTRPHVVQSGHLFANLYAAAAAAASGALSLGALRSSLAYARAANGSLTSWQVRAPHGLVANSRSAAEEVHASRCTTRPVYVVPNAIEIEPAPPRAADARDRDAPVVAFVGRLVPVKRLELFLEALALARRSVPALTGLVVGDGPERSRGEARAVELGLSPGAVRFLGARDDVPSLLEAADMLLLCSEQEGFPNVLLEAMAAGLPVVTTRAGDAADVVRDGETGFVVREEGAEALAGPLVRLAGSHELRLRLGELGRIRVEGQYGFGGLCDRLLGVYGDLAERRRHAPALAALA